ncbi:unnamed protein product [Toxocara canis]|uniref:ANK_REP_REGION domain-containing protein n=1 Tax=Toxocara canis TaxID=6265 RepID=A0A183V1K3_TOXCA|nr:unnamed protein product [Toxocara canis]
MSDDSCELSGNTSMRSPCNLQNTLVEQMSAKGVSINDTGLSFGITEKMARMALSDNHHRCYAEANSETNVVDPDLELAASELSFNLTDEASDFCIILPSKMIAIYLLLRGFIVGYAKKRQNRRPRALRSNSSVLSSEFAPAVMSTPYYERNDDSIDAVEFTFQPWGEEGDKWDKDSSKSAAVKKSMSPNARVNAISAIDPFIRYMSEKKRVIDAINEVSESEESDKDFESAILTQDSMRVQVYDAGLFEWIEGREGWKRSRREPSLNEGNEAITLTEISDIAQGGNAFAYQPRLLRSLSQSNISQGSVSISSNGTKFRSANSESSLLVDVQSIGDYGTHSRDSSNISANKRRPTRRRSKSCSASQSGPHFHCGDLPSLNDKRNCKLNDSTFAKTLKTDNAVREQQWRVKPNKSQWRNGEYFSDRWERFVSRKLLFDISKRFDECEDDEFDVFIPDEILERSSAKELAQTRLAVKRAVRHIRDDPRMAQILLDYTGDINDVSAARRHYRMTINNDTAFADLSKSFTSALIHFLVQCFEKKFPCVQHVCLTVSKSFSNEPPTEKDDEYHSATVEQKTEKLKCGRTRKKPLVSPK